MDELIDYSLIAEDGEMFYTRITKRDAAMYEMAHSMPHSASDTSKSAGGKTGAQWKAIDCYRLLQICMPYRKWLRNTKTVPDAMFQLLASQLKVKHGYNFNQFQVKEKLRNLRNTFRNCKKGLGSGTNWENYWSMVYIYDDPIVEGDVTLAPEGFNPDATEAFSHPIAPIPVTSTVGSDIQPQSSLSYLPETHLSPPLLAAGSVPSPAFATPAIGGSCSPPTNSEFLSLLSSSVSVLNNFSEHDDYSLWGEPPLSSTQLPRSSPAVDNSLQHEGDVFSEVENNINDLTVIDEEEEINNAALVDVNQNLRSPAKKKGQRDDGTIQIIHRTPQKTPRKKPSGTAGATPSNASPARSIVQKRTPRRNLCSQTDLVWAPAKVKLLLAECLLRKNKEQQQNVPVATWKEISGALKDIGETVKWEVCRGKFHSLSDYFSEKLLHTGGILSGVKVPYYDLLCQIHDVPVDLVMPSEVTPTGNKVWDRAGISLLLSLYKARQHLFNGTNSCVRHSTLFREIASAMDSFKIHVSGKQCSDKFSELKQRYHQEYDDSHRSGASPSTWEYYQDMNALFGETAGIKPPFTVSLGTSTSYQVKGKECQFENANSRTRPT
ncbi:hypothetical protein FOCC_FOCC014558 [Frankliniella occidentalis]|nr:hypothetical protein FOCC_FOCC014558 [Frankliniella occidentalis]